MASEIVQYSLEDGVAVVGLDDGKANAVSHALLDGLDAALDRADKDEAKALVIAGREGRFSGGFDLSVMGQGPEAAMELVNRGAALAVRCYDSPRPVVLACTGHAVAMGAVLLLSADERIGADGAFKIGLNEVAIRMTLPEFALIFAEERLSRRHLVRATSAAEIYSPRDAVDAGYLDRVVAPEAVVDEAIARARTLGETLDPVAHRNTKRALRRPALERLRASLD